AFKTPQIVRQVRQIITRDLVMCDRVREINFFVLTVVEACDGDRHWRYPVGNRKACFRVLSLKLAHADQHIRGSYFKREIIERLFTEPVQIRIPRFARANVVTSAARVGQHFVPAVFHGDRMDLTHRWGFVENSVERAVLFPALLNKVQVLASLGGHARDAQRGKQSEFQYALSRNEWLKSDRRTAKQVIVLPDYRFDVVAARGKQPPFLLRTRGARLKLGFQVLEIPDPVVHSSNVAIDERHFFRRIDLWNSAHTSAHEETQVFVRCSVHVGVEERRVFRIINGREDVSVHVVDRFALQECLGHSFGYLVAVPNFLLPMLENGGGFGRRTRPGTEDCGELGKLVGRETKHRFCEIFLGGRAAAAPDHLVGVNAEDGSKGEVSLADENGASFKFAYPSQESDRSGF